MQEPIDGDRVAIYIRWSTEDQGEGTTLAVQREACEAYIRSQGWTFREELLFIDNGCSGGSLERPELSRLRAAIRAGEVGGVVVYKLDRLSRSVLDTVKLVLDEWEGHCFLKSAREPLDTASQAGRLFFYQLVAFAEWERSAIRERTFAGKLRRAREGKNPGITAAYGYRLAPGGDLVVEPSEAAVVQLIFRLYLSGLGCMQVARRLDELGHPSPAGRRWNPAQLSRMLGNPIYMGRLVYGKQVTVGGRRVRSDKPLLVRDGAAPAIIDADTFAAVQRAKGARPAPGRTGGGSGRALASQSLLTGLLRCRCGRACGASATGSYRYYACAAARTGGACRAGRIPQAELDGLVAGALLERYNDAETRRRVAAALGDEAARRRSEALVALEGAQRELHRVQEKAGRLRSLLLEGALALAEYRELRADLAGHVSELVGRAEGARSQAEAALPPGAGPEQGLPLWESLAPQERKQLLRHLVREIRAYREPGSDRAEVEITWRCTAC
jgi:site-specific DNA recombinase